MRAVPKFQELPPETKGSFHVGRGGYGRAGLPGARRQGSLLLLLSQQKLLPGGALYHWRYLGLLAHCKNRNQMNFQLILLHTIYPLGCRMRWAVRCCTVQMQWPRRPSRLCRGEGLNTAPLSGSLCEDSWTPDRSRAILLYIFFTKKFFAVIYHLQ